MTDDEKQSPTHARLAEVVRDVLGPLVAVDGGSIEWLGLRDGVAEVQFGGACAGCPGQTFTTRAVVLPALRVVDPTIQRVVVKVKVEP